MTEIDTTQLTQTLLKLAAKLENVEPTLRKIGAYQERRLAQAFRENRSPDGTPWHPLSPKTLAQKKNPKMLAEAIGRIPASLFYEARGNSLTVGYGDKLAAIHHTGATIPARTLVPKNKRALYWAGAKHPVRSVNIPVTKLPARPLIGFSAEDVKRWEAIAAEDLEDLER